MKTRYRVMILALLPLVFFVSKWALADEPKMVCGIVFAKSPIWHSGKYAHIEPTLALRTDDGRLLDEEVPFAVYEIVEIGDKRCPYSLQWRNPKELWFGLSVFYAILVGAFPAAYFLVVVVLGIKD